MDLITVDAVVLDGKGRPVPGLAREDFVVTEDGRSLEIASFEAIEAQAAPMAMPADADERTAVVANSSPSRPGRAYAVFLGDGPPPLRSPWTRPGARLPTWRAANVEPTEALRCE